MALGQESASSQAKALVDNLYGLVHRSSARQRHSDALWDAIAAIIADLLAGYAADPEQWAFRPMGKPSFDGQRIGYRPCISALTALVAFGFLEHQAGFKCSRNRDLPGQSSRYRATAGLIEIALRHGITPTNWASYFKMVPPPARVAHPIIVRGERKHWHDDRRGGKLMIDRKEPAYVRAAKQVEQINTFIADQHITGCSHPRFTRIFNNGNTAGFAYNQGGRLYALGKDSYQTIEREKRGYIRVNGETVVELDIRTSHLSILYAKKGLTLDSDRDPYELDDLPRPVVKAWLTMTLGYDRFQRRWPAHVGAKLMEKEGIDLAGYPIHYVRDAMLDRHPVLKEWASSKLRWGDLQYIESCAIIDAVEELAQSHWVVGLPLHDALLIPESKIAVATDVLTGTFEHHVGIKPVLKVK